VKAYNSNGLWLSGAGRLWLAERGTRVYVDEGGFTALKLRLGRDRPSDDLAAISCRQGALLAMTIELDG